LTEEAPRFERAKLAAEGKATLQQTAAPSGKPPICNSDLS
jgi:hypothetical protein